MNKSIFLQKLFCCRRCGVYKAGRGFVITGGADVGSADGPGMGVHIQINHKWITLDV